MCNRLLFSGKEHFDSEGQFNRLNELLEEQNGSEYWCNGCIRIILYCMKYDDMRQDTLLRIFLFECFYEIHSSVIISTIFCPELEKNSRFPFQSSLIVAIQMNVMEDLVIFMLCPNSLVPVASHCHAIQLIKEFKDSL